MCIRDRVNMGHQFVILSLIFHIFLTPLLVFRIHNLFFPIKEGNTDLSAKKYNPWWGSYMFQYPFIALPSLEAILHLIPGLYSLWLRMWGSKIGKKVVWTPRVQVLDRGLLEVGDRVVVGHMCAFCSHAITAIDEKPMLKISKVILGAKSFIGADSQFGPGVNIPAGEMVPAKSRKYWKGEY